MREMIMAVLLATTVPTGAATGADHLFTVFFDTAKSDLSKDSVAALDEVIAEYQRAGAVTVRVDGYSDSYGTAAGSRLVSQKRADSVRTYLETHGVPRSAIVIVAHGEEDLLVPTTDGVMEAQNRRVELHLGAGLVR